MLTNVIVPLPTGIKIKLDNNGNIEELTYEHKYSKCDSPIIYTLS